MRDFYSLTRVYEYRNQLTDWFARIDCTLKMQKNQNKSNNNIYQLYHSAPEQNFNKTIKPM